MQLVLVALEVCPRALRKVTCPERQGPTTQAKKKSKHRCLLQQVGFRHGTYDTTVRQAPPSKLNNHP
eukprot:1158224-Pelagomonas_calceolata.AAC.1